MSQQDTLLRLIGDVVGVLDLDEFRWALLRALQDALPVDWISLNDIGESPDEIVVLSDPPSPPELLAEFMAYAHENPLLAHYVRTRDGRPIRFSDLLTAGELHRLELYRRVYRPLGIEYQMSFTLPNGPNRILGIALSRRTHDFSESERVLIERARPFLIQAYRNAVSHTQLVNQVERPRPTIPDAAPLRARGLSGRESEVICLLATGAAGDDIATQLGISVRTVEKHLQNSYRRLGVRTRAQAAAIAWGG